ncbi:tigger transposable element-derived protein 6-like [Schistocerca serialis cubense]|uniref:tigger transposable element-derived protein 6-like n=1 Tax=Schistocerca serialis cubense TaxID=2023355 RepID=UPI00214E6493|nr:tigger transposable element-derived protein 6-like [Schistocerca serialis cubense]
MEGFEDCGNSKCMHLKPLTYDEMEEVLLTWFQQAHLREFDAKMGSAARKVLLFVDICAAHPPDVSFLRNVKVIFLPPNCTSHLKPLDLGIIHALKVKYRTALVKEALILMDQRKPGSQPSSQLKLNILQAMNLIMHSWREVSAENIENCFTKAGFCENEVAAPVEDVASDL